MLAIVSKMTLTIAHATLLFFQKGSVNKPKRKKAKNDPSDFQKENMLSVEKSNLTSVMFVVFLILHNAIILENALCPQKLASIQRWASKNISKSVTFSQP